MTDFELNSKWNFLEKRKASMGLTREDSSFAPFVKNKIRCLVREYIQNSLDVHSEVDTTGPIEVSFSYGQLNCASYPNLIGSLEEHFEACSKHCKQFQNSKDPYKSKIEYLKEHIKGKLGYLKVSDYNTTGMSYIDDEEASAFQACVRESSASFKSSENAGGSHGQGKTVGFVNSGINAVFYSTKDENGKTYGEGVIKLCDHKMKNSDSTYTKFEAIAFYDCHNGEHPNIGEEIPEIFRRDEVGTDAYILGMEKNEEDIHRMKSEILRSFFKAIFENKLTVTVEGDHINKENLEEKIVEFFTDEEYGFFDTVRTQTPSVNFNPRPYFMEALLKANTDEDHIVLTTEEDFPEQFTKLGKATLYLWKSTSIKEAGARDSIVYMRDNSMAIEVKRRNSSKGYNAICVCDGVGSSSLRKIENITHDKWDESELRDIEKSERAEIRAIKYQIKGFINACEEKVFPELKDQEKIILSLKKHRIGTSSNKTNSSEEDEVWPTTNITEKLKQVKTGDGSITILETQKGRKKKKAQGKPSPEITLKQSDRERNPQTNLNPDDLPTTDYDPTENPKNPIIEGDGDASGYSPLDDSKRKNLKEIKLERNNKFLLPCRDGLYACKLVLRVPKDFEGCKLALKVQGITGKLPLELKNVGPGLEISGEYNNEISGFKLHKDKNNIILFTPIENIKNYTLIIEAYGH